jgi:hypothetical protein
LSAVHGKGEHLYLAKPLLEVERQLRALEKHLISFVAIAFISILIRRLKHRVAEELSA